MPKITLDIPQENIALLLEVTEVMGIENAGLIEKEGVPDWHKQILNERMENYKAGKTKLTEWVEFEKDLDQEDTKDEL